jgi:hypothetical protein
MNHEERLITLAKSLREVRQAIGVLETLGFNTAALSEEYASLRTELETYVPKDYPEKYRIRNNPVDITEHLTGNRDMLPSVLHSPSSNGRIYTLTKGQRAILRERYGMTPTKEVKVLEVSTWPAAPTCVQHIVITSTEHVPEHRRHLLNRAVIDDWVTFCTAAEAIDIEVDVHDDGEKSTKPTKPGNEKFADLLSQYL